MRLTALIALLCVAALGMPAVAGAARRVRIVSVPGETEWLVVDAGAAFILRRTNNPYVVRVDLATGRRTVAFRTDGFPWDTAYAGGGVLAFELALRSGHAQAVAIPTAPGGQPAVLRDTGDGCSDLMVDDVSPGGGVLLSTFSSPCGNRKDGTEVISLLGLNGGEQTLMSIPTDLDGLPLGNLSSPTLAAGSWLLRRDDEQHLRLIDSATGTVHRFRSTLPGARLLPSDLQPDGRFLLGEIEFRRHGGYVQRTRLVRPADGRRGGRVLGTLGTPPRLNATFCGGRLVILRTKGRRTRVVVNGKEIARLSTPADPRFGCDAKNLVVEAAGAATRLGVVSLQRESTSSRSRS